MLGKQGDKTLKRLWQRLTSHFLPCEVSYISTLHWFTLFEAILPGASPLQVALSPSF